MWRSILEKMIPSSLSRKPIPKNRKIIVLISTIQRLKTSKRKKILKETKRRPKWDMNVKIRSLYH